jgi:methyltransferase-like protein/2-polyprenyl-3-methyl-5-hydroxy-6-metoxy-1,4-benzoquinol methylase
MDANSYDQIPYAVQSHPSAHIRKLEAMATLFGMHPQPTPHCRVLELGCASASNLTPQAIELPQSEFVGVELSERQVKQGQSIITTLGLPNIELRAADLLDIDASWGQFDYILCHGVYSWVPHNVQDKIMTICRENLSPNGVALVSHNVLPGWNFRGTIRDMMLYHVSKLKQPGEKIAQARSMLSFMTENCSTETTYGQVLREELDFISTADDEYLFHDHLEDHNHPIYFYQFMERAEAEGLQFLDDSDLASMLSVRLSPAARDALAGLPLVQQQQYMDFLRNRKFCRTLLCHQAVSLTRAIGVDDLRKFQLLLANRPEPFKPSFDSNEPLTLRVGKGEISISAGSPLAIAALEHLSNQWPRPITLDELHAASIQRLANVSNCGESFELLSVADTARTLMGIFADGLLDYFVHPPTIANLVSNRPLASPLARLQASSGISVTNQRHQNCNLDDFCRYLVTLLDSEHDRAQMFDKIQAALAKGELTMPEDSETFQRVDQAHLEDVIANTLTRLCKGSLLKA